MKFLHLSPAGSSAASPSMRREWIEMLIGYRYCIGSVVSLHAEGVD